MATPRLDKHDKIHHELFDEDTNQVGSLGDIVDKHAGDAVFLTPDDKDAGGADGGEMDFEEEMNEADPAAERGDGPGRPVLRRQRARHLPDRPDRHRGRHRARLRHPSAPGPRAGRLPGRGNPPPGAASTGTSPPAPTARSWTTTTMTRTAASTTPARRCPRPPSRAPTASPTPACSEPTPDRIPTRDERPGQHRRRTGRDPPHEVMRSPARSAAAVSPAPALACGPRPVLCRHRPRRLSRRRGRSPAQCPADGQPGPGPDLGALLPRGRAAAPRRASS